MKKAFFLVFIAVFITITGQSQTKVEFDIAETLSFGELDLSVVRGVYSVIADYFFENDFVLAANEYTFRQLLDIEKKNQIFSRILPAEHTPIQGGIYSLIYEKNAEGKYRFVLSHVNMAGDEDKRSNSNSHPLLFLRKEDGQKLVAYEIITKFFGLTEQTQKILETLRDSEDDFLKRVELNYTALSFLPPINQFRSGTRQGKTNGWAILTGYTVSIIGFGVSTHYYNENKRNFEGVTVDLSEAEKARNYYKSKMELYCGGQIASGILFFGTYIYGVANALAKRDTYSGVSKNTSMKIAPVAYDNGAGIALVYSF